MIRKIVVLAIVVALVFYWLGSKFIGQIISAPAAAPVVDVVADGVSPTSTAVAAATSAPVATSVAAPATVMPTPTTVQLAAVEPVRVQFPSGTWGTDVNGQWRRGGMDAYILWARENQNMKVHLASSGGGYLTVQRAVDGTVGLQNVSAGTTATVTLPYSGDYVVTVYGGEGSYQLAFEIR